MKSMILSDSKFDFLHTIRAFLEPYWLEAHKSWGVVPPIISKQMCIYTCLFLKFVLEDIYSEEWRIMLARPKLKYDKTCKGKFGYKTPDNIWHDHAWLAHERGIIVDLTGDQFGGTPIYFGPLKTNYNANHSEGNILIVLEKLQKRVDTWVDDWKINQMFNKYESASNKLCNFWNKVNNDRQKLLCVTIGKL